MREKLGITGSLPFFGLDFWNAYELSWLNLRGKPQVGIMNFSVSADSPNIVESKSLKLYLNSFTQTRMDEVDDLIQILRSDLSDAFGLTSSGLDPAAGCFYCDKTGRIERPVSRPAGYRRR